MRYSWLVGWFFWSVTAQAAAPQIAIVVDGPSDVYQDDIRILAEEIDALVTETESDFSCPTAPTHVGDFSQAGAEARLQEALGDRRYKLVLGIGVRVGQAAAKIERLPKPLLLPYGAPRIQKLPRKGDRSGRKNLAYLGGLVNLERDLRRFREVIRRDKVVFLLDQHFFDAIPDLAKLVQQLAGDSLRPIAAGSTAAEILAATPQDAQAVFIGTLIRLPKSEIQPLLDGYTQRKLPTYATEGRSWVEMGAFGSLVAEDDRRRRMRQIALYVGDALRGEDPGGFSTTFEPRSQLTINMTTAQAIGVFPRFELLSEADVIGGSSEVRKGRTLSLSSVAEEALAANLDLTAVRYERNLAEEQHEEAVGSLFPSVNADGQFIWLDPNVANPLANAERTLSWGLNANQLVYSARAIAGVQAADKNRDSVNAGIRTNELDTVLSAGLAYLDVLRTLTAERINRDNLKRTRRNLELAEIRVEVGSAGREEVFRWQAQLADSRTVVIQASAQRNQAEIAMNALINRPLEEPFALVEPQTPDDAGIVPPLVAAQVSDPGAFRVFRDFMAVEAVRLAPELAQFNAAVEAQQRVYDGLLYQLFIPDAALTGGFTHTPHRSGEGSGMLPTGGFPDRFVWQFGAVLSFNVFDLSRYAVLEQNQILLDQLRAQQDAASLGIRQRVRSALHRAGASSAAVQLRRDAAEAAHQNLQIVIDLYKRGATNVIQLIDAQNQALAADLNAANAVYDFLGDYLRVERAAGQFSFRLPPEAASDFEKRLSQFIARPEQNKQ